MASPRMKGQQQPPPRKEPLPKPIRRTNRVKVSVIVKEGQVIIEPPELVLNVSNREEALWRCEQGKLEVRFSPRDTPFSADRYEAPKSGGCLSGLPLPQAANKSFQYTVLITTTDGVFTTSDRLPPDRAPRVTVRRKGLTQK
jgi:hypothetical protein